MLGAGMAESVSGKISLTDCEPESVRAMLRFLYSDKLRISASFAIDLLALADRCGMSALRSHCERLIVQTHALDDIDDLIMLIDVAHQYSAKHLLRLTSNALKASFSRKVSYIFLKTKTKSREILISLFETIFRKRWNSSRPIKTSLAFRNKALFTFERQCFDWRKKGLKSTTKI